MKEHKTKTVSVRVPITYLEQAEARGFSVMEALRAYIVKLSKAKKCPTCGEEKVKK